jgi:membrane protein
MTILCVLPVLGSAHMTLHRHQATKLSRKAKEAWLTVLGVGMVAASALLAPRTAADSELQPSPAPATYLQRTLGPFEMPTLGWTLTVRRVFAGINDNRILAEAAAVTFYALLAIFPGIAALISLYGLIADPASIAGHVSSLRGVVPDGGIQLIADQINALAKTGNQALSFGAVLGFLTSIWSANAGVKAMFDALNAVYREQETRSYVHRTWLSLCFTLGALVFTIIAITAVVVLPAVLNFFGLGATTNILLKLSRWPLLLAGVAIFLSVIYRYGPSRENARWHWLTWGSALASVAWVVASLAFSYYVANFGSYNKTYGSLGAAVGFMTWIWISTIITLIGAQLNAALEQQTARDTTTGPAKLSLVGAA